MNKKCGHKSHNENCMQCQFTKIEYLNRVYPDSIEIIQIKQRLDRWERKNNLTEYYG